MSSNDNQAVLTVSELCERWKCTRKIVLARIHDDGPRKLHAFRIGDRAYRVAMSEVLRWESGQGKAA
jgi:hypothetical protein